MIRYTNQEVSTPGSSTCEVSPLQRVLLQRALWSHLGIKNHICRCVKHHPGSLLFWSWPNSKRESPYPYMLITAGNQDPELSNRLGLRTLSWNHNSALFHILFVLLSSAQAGCVSVTLRFSPHGHHSNPGSQKTTATMLSISFNPGVLQLACSINPALVWKVGTHIQVAIEQKSN